MSSLCRLHSWQPGLQLDAKDPGIAEASVSRAGVLLAHRRHNMARAAAQRRCRRFRTCLRLYRGLIRATKCSAAYHGISAKGEHTEPMSFSNGPLNQACKLLRLEGADELQDLISSLILSECVYKKLELDEESVAAKVTEFASGFPPGWVQLEAVQLSLAGIPQHYLIATSSTSMYVAFMGTKQFQDILADANLLHTPVWAESARLAADRQSIPAAHRGFLERARAIHVEQLYELAVSQGLRLVLCGHSLGGAVAKLCTLRLLRELPDWPRPRIRCIAFATPAVGNAALAELVENAGWASHFSTYYLPEDQLVRLISFSQARSTPSSTNGNGVGGPGAGGSMQRNRARADRRQRAKERTGSRARDGGMGATAHGLGKGRAVMGPGFTEEERPSSPAPLRPTASASSSSGVETHLDEALVGILGKRGTGTGTGGRGLPWHAQTVEGLTRAPSASSIASAASSCATEEASSSSSCSSNVHRHCSFDIPDARMDSRLSLLTPPLRLRSVDSATRNSSIGDFEGSSNRSSLSDYTPPQAQPKLPFRSQAKEDQASMERSPHGELPGSVTEPRSGARVSVAESIDEDHAGVAIAMEEILAPGPDELEAAAAVSAAGVALSGMSPTELAAAQREALYGNAGGSWGLRLALGRKRVMRRLRRLATRAQIPLPKALLPVSRYHTFGEQWFVTEDGALSFEELELASRRPKDQEQQQQQEPQQYQPPPPPQGSSTPPSGSQAKSLPEGARGFFSFHRMVAYRQRHADIISRLVKAADEVEHVKHSVGQVQGEAQVLQPQTRLSAANLPAGESVSVVDTLPRGGGGSAAAAVQLSDSLLPRISVHRAILRGVMPAAPAAATATTAASQPEVQKANTTHAADSGQPPEGAFAGDGNSNSAPANQRRAALLQSKQIVAPVVGHILNWVWGGSASPVGLYGPGRGAGGLSRGPEEPVQLELELEGKYLQYCRKVSVALVAKGTDTSSEAAASPRAERMAEGPPMSRGVVETSTERDGEVVVSGGGWGLARWTPVTWGGGRGVAWKGRISSTSARADHADQDQDQDQQQVPDAERRVAQPSSQPPHTAATGPSTRSQTPKLGPSSSPLPGIPSAIVVPCEVVQVLYAQPYSDAANPPPLHPVSLLRNTLHHFARNLMGRWQLPGRGQGHGRAEGQARHASTGVAPPWASMAALVGGAGGARTAAALAEAVGGRAGPGRRFRFPPNQRPASATSMASILKGKARHESPAANVTVRGQLLDRRDFTTSGELRGWKDGSPCPELRGSSHNRSTTTGADGCGLPRGVASSGKNAVTVEAMPSRLLLRVTLQSSVARGLLDGTLPAQLVVSARSDFHALSHVPVAVHRPLVAILGTSPYVASLVQAVLSAPAALAAASLGEQPVATGFAGAAGAPATGLAAWVPPPMARALAAVRRPHRAAVPAQNPVGQAGSVSAAHPTATAVAESEPGAVPASLPHSQRAQAAAGSRPSFTVPHSAEPASAQTAAMAMAVATTNVKSLEQKGRLVPWWVPWNTGHSVPRFRLRLGKPRWGIRQSLAAAVAVGAAAASAAGGMGAAAAVGAAAVVASTLAAFTSDGGAVSVFTNAAVTVAAVVAGAAAAANAFAGSEAAVLVAAAASAAAVAMAAATSTGPGVIEPPPQQQQQQQAETGKSAGAASHVASTRLPVILQGLPNSIPAPRLSFARAGANPMSAASAGTPADRTPVRRSTGTADAGSVAAAVQPALLAPEGPRWLFRFGVPRPTSGQASARNAQIRGSGGSGGAANLSTTAGSGAAAGGPVGRGWVLWRPGSTSRVSEGREPEPDGCATAPEMPLPQPPPPPSPRGQWLSSWPVPWAELRHRSPEGVTASGLAAPTSSVASLAASSSRSGRPGLTPPVVAMGSTAAAAAATDAASKPPGPGDFTPPIIPTELRRRWLRPLGAVFDAAATAAATGAGRPPVTRGVSLAQLRTQLLSSLRSGSGRAALPLPSGVLADGMDLCNVMVEPMASRGPAWGSRSRRAGSAAWTTAAVGVGKHDTPLRMAPPRPRATSAAAGAAAAVPSVPAAVLWKGRCQCPATVKKANTSAAVIPSAEAPISDAAVATVAAVPGRIRVDPRAGAEAVRAALDSAAAAAAAAASSAAAVAMMGAMPACEGCPEMVGVAPCVAMRRLEAGLRRQVLQRGMGWRGLLGGVVGVLLRPVTLMGMLRRLPGWGLLQVLRRGYQTQGPALCGPQAAVDARWISTASSIAGPAATSPEPLVAGSLVVQGHDVSVPTERPVTDWGAIVVVASCRDALRVLRGRDMEALRNRAADAACRMVPVLLTCAQSPLGRRAAALRALAAACGVSPEDVRVVWLDAALLHQPAAAIPRLELPPVWRATADCEGAAELRDAVRRAAAAAAVLQAERHEH